MFGLDSEIIELIQEVFSKFEQIEKVVLYGSRAKGNFRNGSDIDITLFGKSLNLQTIYDIEQELEELYLPYKFDISIYEHIENPDLRAHIDRVGKVFYEKNL